MHGMVSPRLRLRAAGFRPALTGGMLLAVACVAAFAAVVFFRPQLPAGTEDADTLNQILLWNSLMPRAAIALIAGAALGLSGALLQRVLRNPIADASTLGISAGAELAMTVALGFFPMMLGIPRELVAFVGGLVAVALVITLSWKRGLDPVTVALAGMMVSIVFSALSVAVVLARGEYAMSIYICGLAFSLGDRRGWRHRVSRPGRADDRSSGGRSTHRPSAIGRPACRRGRAAPHRLHRAAPLERLFRPCADRSGNSAYRRAVAALFAAAAAFGKCNAQ